MKKPAVDSEGLAPPLYFFATSSQSSDPRNENADSAKVGVDTPSYQRL